MKLHTSGEDYLEAILVLKRLKGSVRSIDLAEHLDVTKPSVSRAVGLMKKGGFLKKESGFLEFTEAGLEIAEKTYEKHCFFKEQLVAAGVDEITAEKEACLLEHAVSEDSFDKIKVNSPKCRDRNFGGRPSKDENK